MNVPMEFGSCPTCERNGKTLDVTRPLGVNCGGCGHHFHIGVGILNDNAIFCPRCEAACPTVEIGDVP